ncbi:kinesin-like protein KIF16B [Alosa sapidissima]|uniref:kinesin-like protein KIF16B n=1 Tax=Alosa sapidissima TaxID=34773 RepID=UPI001C09D697|nr:kinesin-like protein KIF16B [Alosa sapidissima]
MVGGVACVTAETTRAAEAAPPHPPSRDHWGCCPRQTTAPASPIQGPLGVLPTADDRINAYIEEEVQRRLKKLNLLNGDNNLDLSLSSRSLKDDEKLNNKVDPRRLKYERLVSVPLGPSPESLKDPVKISIPRYVLRGQGKDEHFEFEVKITVLDETWTVFRRYSRFREMHKSLKIKYPELGGLEFPPKKLFGNRDERMVSERRNHLERYLRNFFRVMMSPSSSSPLKAQEGGAHLSKHAVCDISPFFKKGVFDYSSHGTG